MRCLALADALCEGGANCRFICRAHEGHLARMIEARGHAVGLLSPTHGAGIGDWRENHSPLLHEHWLATDWQTDAKQTITALASSAPCDWLVVDHYALDERWERALRSACRQLMVIDDLADRRHDCDLLLDQNWHGQRTDVRYRACVAPSARVLLGPKYALLRPEYRLLRSLMPTRDGYVRRVLVSMGGGDPNNQTAKVLRALTVESLYRIVVDVVIGPNHPDPERIVELAAIRPNTILHRSPESLVGLMARADLMISAGGSTTWERMCLGLPALTIGIADNQIETQRALMADGYGEFLGEMSDIRDDDISRSVLRMTRSVEGLVNQSELCQSVVDGLGIYRVSAEILGNGYVSASRR